MVKNNAYPAMCGVPPLKCFLGHGTPKPSAIPQEGQDCNTIAAGQKTWQLQVPPALRFGRAFAKSSRAFQAFGDLKRLGLGLYGPSLMQLDYSPSMWQRCQESTYRVALCTGSPPRRTACSIAKSLNLSGFHEGHSEVSLSGKCVGIYWDQLCTAPQTADPACFSSSIEKSPASKNQQLLRRVLRSSFWKGGARSCACTSIPFYTVEARIRGYSDFHVGADAFLRRHQPTEPT